LGWRFGRAATDRVAVPRSGRIEQVDTPERLYAWPANEFVREFLN
jgi:ABC-type Fe3+/spermidine/putrescine transport system ATPase subunit